MSFNIVPFESLGAFPVALGADAFDLNIAAEEFASVKFPVISLKAGRFHIKREGVLTLITREKVRTTDPDEPASYIDMVVLNLQKSKTYYAEGYTDGSDAKPNCQSSDGIMPDATAQEPQCATCALCPHNAWGSGRNEKGEATKGKACSDGLRLAVATPTNLGAPYMLRVPPASLKNFSEMAKWLTGKREPVNKVVVRIAFDVTKVGVLTFQAIGGLDAATYAKANELKNSELVLSITGKSVHSLAQYLPPNPVVAQSVVAAPPAPAVDPDVAKKKTAAEAKAKKLADAKAALAAAEADTVVEEAKPAPAPASVTVTTSDSFDAALAELLG